MGRTLPLAARNTDARDGTDGSPSETNLLQQCVEPQRRNAIEALCEEGSLSLDALADHVAARQSGCTVSDVPDDVTEQVEIGLYHTHLQKLSEAGIVVRSDEDERSTVTLSSGVDPDRVRELIQRCHGSWTALEALLSDERRQHVVSRLTSANGTLSLDELAEAIAALERERASSPSDTDPESVRISLHHVHLPKLDDAGVLDYDHEQRRAGLEGLPDAYETVVADEPESAPA